MYGWRARIGLILPSLNVTMEPEFYRMIPEGISVHTTRVLLEEGRPDKLEKMADDSAAAARLLATCDVDGIMYGCTSGSLIKGVGWDLEIVKMIEDATGIPTSTTSTGVIEAFRELGVTKVAVATPYIQPVNDLEKEFFEGHGVKVVNIEGLGYTKGGDLHSVPRGTAYSFGKKVDRPEAECVFVSCTDFHAIHELDALERDTGKPAMCSNTASLWAIFKKLGIREPIEGYGEILHRL
ncbi:MAG: maleate cis-trans isomerase [Thermoleophilia bacterium]|nr:maleate cis-trans isomerase [Thermoleophilia bacterium]